MISAPLRDRFGSVFRLEYYDAADMKVIVDRSARILETKADPEGVEEIASRSRGTPRIANRLLKRSRDYALVKADNRVTGPVARAALAQLNVDQQGLDPVRPQAAGKYYRQIRRRAGGAGYLGRRHKRGRRHHHGRMGALPAPVGLSGAHAPGAGGDPLGP